MGFLSKLFGSRPVIQQLPSGSITVSRNGDVLTTTVSSTYPRALLREIAREVLRQFYEARQAQLSLEELNLHFGSLRITARQIQGGAVIFLAPRSAETSHPRQDKAWLPGTGRGGKD
ncbi:MAG TPA: hypothetical protein VMH30_08355 [Verrucomicrobiae bacterium]|nr:hypothetical protein [Verrucomicrobiae bacterium]